MLKFVTNQVFGEIHDLLKSNKVGVGLAINPDTSMPDWSKKFIPSLDQIIVMSVVPGKSGQKYIENTHEKTKNPHGKFERKWFYWIY